MRRSQVRFLSAPPSNPENVRLRQDGRAHQFLADLDEGLRLRLEPVDWPRAFQQAESLARRFSPTLRPGGHDHHAVAVLHRQPGIGLADGAAGLIHAARARAAAAVNGEPINGVLPSRPKAEGRMKNEETKPPLVRVAVLGSFLHSTFFILR